MDDQHLFPKSGATFFEWLNATGSGFRHVPSPQTCPVGVDRRDRPAPATFHPDTKTPDAAGHRASWAGGSNRTAPTAIAVHHPIEIHS